MRVDPQKYALIPCLGPLGSRLVVGQRTLDPYAGVRILPPQPIATPTLGRKAAVSSRGPGRSPLKAQTGVRIPVPLPANDRPLESESCDSRGFSWQLPDVREAGWQRCCRRRRERYDPPMRRVWLSLVIGALVVLVNIVAGTNALDSTLVGGLTAVAVYIMATSLRRLTPVAPDRNYWIAGPGGPPEDGGDGGDGGDGD